MVIQVDFDLAMTVLSHKLLRLLAHDLPPGYRRLTPRSLLDSRGSSPTPRRSLSPRNAARSH